MRNYFLKTQKLGFSIWRTEDLKDAMELWGNPAVTKFITADGKMTDEQIFKRLAREIDSESRLGFQYWPVYMLETSNNIGCCGLRPYDEKNNILEMGVHLKEKYWGQGFAVEACSAVIEYGFNTLGIRAIFAGHNPKNLGSAKLLGKLGFKYTHDELYLPTGIKHPSYIITRQEFRAKHDY